MGLTFSELELTYMLVSAKGTGLEVNAYIERANGTIHIDNEELNEGDSIPHDLDNNDKYVRVPTQDELLNEFELMKLLAARQLDETEQQEFQQLTMGRGQDSAVREGIHYLNSIGKLPAWRQLVTNAQEQALRNWAEQQGLRL